MVELFKIRLHDAGTIVMKAEIHIVTAVILRKVDKAGITVFDDIIDQFLYDAEDQEFLLNF